MNTNKLLAKLEGFLGLSAHKQQQKHHKLQKIIRKLEAKREKLEEELVEAGKADETSARYHDLNTELKVIHKLIKKAKQHDVQDQAS